jgi:AcrR family transcriptional regulator
MLATATAMISRRGLTVGLDHISFEDVIRRAEVSRSAAYRRWPHKDLFFSDLVLHLAHDAVPTLIEDELALMRQILTNHHVGLSTAQARERLTAELIRQLAALDFDALLASPAWRTYIALHATCASIADPGLKERLRAALADTERAHVGRIADAWQQLAELLGYRLRGGLSTAGFTALARLLNSTMRGILMTALSTPEIAEPYQAAPFPPGENADWTPAAIALGAIATTFLEPDPTITWDKQRIATIQTALADWRPSHSEGSTTGRSR